MKKIILTAFVTGLVIVSCSKKEDATKNENTNDTIENVANDSIPVSGENSKTAVDWHGTYEGDLPCADCEGIKTTITLNSDDTYTLTTDYLGKNQKNEESGKFTWDTNGNQITITTKDGQSTKYMVGENQLIQLDQEGNRITGAIADKYVLVKK